MIQNTLLFSTKFNAAIIVPKFVLTDLSPYADEGITLSNVKGVFKIEGPTGIIYNNTNFGVPDITGNVSLIFNSVSIPLDTTGAIVTGSYKITYTIRVAGGTQPGDYSFVDTSYYCYVAPTGIIQVTNSVRLATVTSSDLTTYAVSGINPTLVRTHSLFYPSALVMSPVVGSAAQIHLAYPNVYTGTYTGKLSTIASYTFSDGLLVDYLITAVDESIVDGSTLCDIYCGLKSLTNEFLKSESVGDFGKSGKIQETLATVGFLLDLYDQAITCGKPDDATTWLNEIIKEANITPGCGCNGDEPTQIIPIGGGGDGGEVIVLGDSSFGTEVDANTVGITTTYTVRLTQAYKTLILGALQAQDLSVTAFRGAGIPEEARGIQVTPLTSGGATISLIPGVSKKVLVVIGGPTLSASTVIQTTGSAIDGDSFMVDYRAIATPNGNNVTIFGIQLTDSEVASGNTLVFAWYAASNSTWYAKLISNNNATPQEGLDYWKAGPDYVLNKAVLYGSNPSLIYKNILAAGSGSNPPTGTTSSNAYWQYVGNKSTLSDASDNIVFDVTTGKPFILPTLNTSTSSFEFLVLEGQEIKIRDSNSIPIIGAPLPSGNILIGNASNVAAILPFNTDSLRGLSLPISGVTGGTFTIITVNTSGTVHPTPNVSTPTIKVIGTTTLIGNYSISPGSSGANIAGDYFWFDYNANVTLAGNTLTIFGLSLTVSEALAGNLAVYSYWDGSSWISRKIIYGQNLPTGTINQGVRFSATNILSADAGVSSDGAGNEKINVSLVVGNAPSPTQKGIVLSDNGTDTGLFNIINGPAHTVTGSNNNVSGSTNNVSGDNNNVAGGNNNVAGDFNISAGQTNAIPGNNNIVNGDSNSVSGDSNSVIGSGNSIACRLSQITGVSHLISDPSLQQIVMTGNKGTSINSSSIIDSTLTPGFGLSQREFLVLTAQSTSATPVVAANNSAAIKLSTNSFNSFEYKIAAVQTAGSSGSVGDSKSFTLKGAIKNIGGTVSLVDTQVISDPFTDSAATTWTAAASADTPNGTINLSVTGQANKTIRWTAALTMIKAGY